MTPGLGGGPLGPVLAQRRLSGAESHGEGDPVQLQRALAGGLELVRQQPGGTSGRLDLLGQSLSVWWEAGGLLRDPV